MEAKNAYFDEINKFENIKQSEPQVVELSDEEKLVLQKVHNSIKFLQDHLKKSFEEYKNGDKIVMNQIFGNYKFREYYNSLGLKHDLDVNWRNFKAIFVLYTLDNTLPEYQEIIDIIYAFRVGQARKMKKYIKNGGWLFNGKL